MFSNMPILENLFKYHYIFANTNIIKSFLYHFSNAYTHTQKYFIDNLRDFDNNILKTLEDLIREKEYEQVFSNIDSKHFPKHPKENETNFISETNNKKNNNHFTNYSLARFYYYIPHSNSYSKQLSSFIIDFHYNFLTKAYLEDINFDDMFRILIHFVELILEIENNSNFIKKKNAYNYPLNYIEDIKSKTIQGKKQTKNNLKEFIITVNEMEMIVSSYITIKSNNYLDSLATKIDSFEKFITLDLKRKASKKSSKEDVSKEFREQHEVNDIIVTLADTENFKNKLKNDEEVQEHEAAKKIRIRTKATSKKETRKKQSRKLQAKSIAIAKSKMQLTSLYSYPSISELSLFFKEISCTLNENTINQYYKNIFLLTMIIGLKPEQTIALLHNDISNIIYKNISDKMHARFDNFNKNIGIETTNEVFYTIPEVIKELLIYIKSYKYDFNNDKFEKTIKDFIKLQNTHISINSQKIWETFFIHQNIFLRSPNTQSIFATENYDQNASPLLNYTQVPQNLIQHSNFLEEYLDILNINNTLKNFFKTSTSKNFIENISLHTAGSKKLLKQESFINLMKTIQELAKSEKNKIRKFNLYSLYVRYALAILVGTRDFNKSVNLTRTSFKYETIHYHEKAKHENDGHRIIPLCSTALLIIQDYFEILQKVGIDEKRICFLTDENTQLGITLSNISKIRKDMFIGEIYQFMDNLKSVPLNLGRHTIVTLCSDTLVSKDSILAFMGHNVAGGEQLGELSLINSSQYKTDFKNILEEISIMFEINKDIASVVGINYGAYFI